MRDTRQSVVYLHGFNSSPASQKARLFVEYCHSRGIVDVLVPALPYDPALAMQLLEKCVGQAAARTTLLVGSSLGGYYATYLAERYGLKAALINPAVAPCDYPGGEFVGRHRNLYTGEEYDFTHEHVEALRNFAVEALADPAQYLLLVQTADEVLDYRLALRLYAGSRQVVQQGGSHSFENFSAVLPQILQFAGLE
jgi:hypothetical protein